MNFFLCTISLAFLGFYESHGISNFSAAVGCGQTTFTESAGSLAYPGSGSTTSRPSSCTYSITTKANTRIELRWTQFKVDADMPNCPGSSVSIYVGCGQASERLIEFCSKNTASLPHDIYTKDNCLKIEYVSSSTASNSFSARYYTEDKDSPKSSASSCSRKKKLYTRSGIIYSPRWPTGYGQQYHDCKWEIDVPSDYLIKLTFMDFDLYRYYSSTSSCSSSAEKLRVEGEKSVMTSSHLKRYYCGDKKPFTLSTRYYELELKFSTSGYRRSNRGFIIGYIAYKSKASAIASKKFKTIAYVGIIIAIVILVGCCGFFAWRRRSRARANAGYNQPPPQQGTVLMETKTVTYDGGALQGPPPYAAAVAQPAPGYPGQSYPGAYPTGQDQSYSPAAGAPYPPTSAAPYPPTSAAPYPPTSAAPYPPTSAAPYPSGGAPYPTADGTVPAYTSEVKQASAPPAYQH